MFGSRFFAARYFGARHFEAGVDAAAGAAATDWYITTSPRVRR